MVSAPIRRAIAARSCAASRPKRKALRLISTAAPLSSMACSMAVGADRHMAQLIGIAQDEHVGRDRVAEQLHGRGMGIKGVNRRLAGALLDGMAQGGAGNLRDWHCA